MATEKYPHQNVNMPMDKEVVAAIRARLLNPGKSPSRPTNNAAPSNGKGSRREVRPGEWVDDRVIDHSLKASPSKDSPPELKRGEGREVPASYDPAKVYQVTLAKPVVYSGRMLSPAKLYQMIGEACTEINATPGVI